MFVCVLYPRRLSAVGPKQAAAQQQERTARQQILTASIMSQTQISCSGSLLQRLRSTLRCLPSVKIRHQCAGSAVAGAHAHQHRYTTTSFPMTACSKHGATTRLDKTITEIFTSAATLLAMEVTANREVPTSPARYVGTVNGGIRAWKCTSWLMNPE